MGRLEAGDWGGQRSGETGLGKDRPGPRYDGGGVASPSDVHHVGNMGMTIRGQVVWKDLETPSTGCSIDNVAHVSFNSLHLVRGPLPIHGREILAPQNSEPPRHHS